MKDSIMVLPNSKAVRGQIKKIFSHAGRKIAVVAYVGRNAAEYLGPRREEIEIYCWPQAGSTNPAAIRDLLQHGCSVHFVDYLHMKIYWSEHGGCVIGSANLSDNALGDAGLFEAGVYLSDSASVKIEGILDSFTFRPVDAESLEKLDRAHRNFIAKNGATRVTQKQRSFTDWYLAKPQESWKLGWWSKDMSAPPSAIERARQEYNLDEPKNFVLGKRGNYAEGDWVLSYKFNENSDCISIIRWLFVERLIKSTEKEMRLKLWSEDLRKWPYQAIQFRPRMHFGEPPFDERDKRFQSAFKSVGKQLGATMMTPVKDCVPSPALIELLLAEYKKAVRW